MNDQDLPQGGAAGFIPQSWAELLQSHPADLAKRLVAPGMPVRLDPLRSGRAGLDEAGVREAPEDLSRRPFYMATEIARYGMSCALVHDAAGILCIGRHVVGTTLNHTGPDAQGYETDLDGRITLKPGSVRTLDGTAYTIQAGGWANYYHWMIDGIGRLAALRGAMKKRPGPLLVPPLGSGFRRQSLQLVHWLDPQAVCEVGPGDAILVARLVAPASVSGAGWSVHPGIGGLFDGMLNNAAPQPDLPRRFYIDRSGAQRRGMRNEPALIEALSNFGVIPVRLETMTVATQARLFGQAELIVGAHGAGLTNLVFARPPCRVLEVICASYVNWCFRVIAAARQLSYDAVICAAARFDAPLGAAIHEATWDAAIPAVCAAVALPP